MENQEQEEQQEEQQEQEQQEQQQQEPDWLNARLDRATKSAQKKLLEQFGASSPDDIQKQLEEYKALKQAQEDQLKSEMTEIERLQAERAEWEQKHRQTAEQLEQIKFEAQVTKICSGLGVRDIDYAKYKISQFASKLADDKDLDISEVEEFIKKEIEDDANAIKYGVKQYQKQTTTYTTDDDLKTRQSGEPPAKKSAHEMSFEEFEEFKRKRGYM